MRQFLVCATVALLFYVQSSRATTLPATSNHEMLQDDPVVGNNDLIKRWDPTSRREVVYKFDHVIDCVLRDGLIQPIKRTYHMDWFKEAVHGAERNKSDRSGVQYFRI